MHNRDCDWLAVAKLALAINKISRLGQTNHQSDHAIVHVTSPEHDWNVDQQGYWKVICVHSFLEWFWLIFGTKQWLRHEKWSEKRGNEKEEPEEERERIISVSGVFSRREQMYASTQRLLLCTKLAPWWVLAAAISILLFPWTPDALTPAAQPSIPPPNTPSPLCLSQQGLKAS